MVAFVGVSTTSTVIGQGYVPIDTIRYVRSVEISMQYTYVRSKIWIAR